MINTSARALGKLPSRATFYRFCLVFFISLSVLIFASIYTHVPISLQLYQTYDDALFIKLGENIANGDWLGTFNQLTLAKGAGYPLFLAVSSWTGASVTLTQAAFYAAASLLLWSVSRRITGSRLFATLAFLIILFNPNIFQPRILRESIYTSQTVTLLCLTWLTLFRGGKCRNVAMPVASGLMLGWFWITREEGVWILPGIAALFLAKFLRNRAAGLRANEILQTGCAYFLAFFFVLLVLGLINFHCYNVFVGVDIKDSSFTSAMQQLQRVHAGAGIPHVPLSKNSRERLYQLSPEFAVLEPTLDPLVGVNPSVGSECWIWPSACHDFSAGQLLWQIRDGAAAAGKYTDEKGAQRYFRRLARRVSEICERKLIPCYDSSPIAMMPHLYGAQLKSLWPGVISAWALLLQKNQNSWIDAPPSGGDQNDLDGARRFLNYPLSTHVASTNTSGNRTVAMSGWFLDDADGWFALDTPSGVRAEVIRLASPDLARVFPRAVTQRFEIKLVCSYSCDVKFVSQNGDVFNFRPGSPPKVHSDIHYGRSVIAFDSVKVQNPREFQASAVMSMSRRCRVALHRLYSMIITPLGYAGICSFLLMIAFYAKRLLSSEAFIFSASIAVLVLSRTAILLLINLSSFPSLTPAYFSPALCLLPVFSIFAIWSLVNAFATSPYSCRWIKR